MAGRAAQYLKLLVVSSNHGASYLLAPAACASVAHKCIWSRQSYCGVALSRLGKLCGRNYGTTSSNGSGEGYGNGGEGKGEAKNGENASGGEEGDEAAREDAENFVRKELEENGLVRSRDSQQQQAIAPVSIPDIFPEVPVLPVSRHPVFPKFVKMIEVGGHKWACRTIIKISY